MPGNIHTPIIISYYLQNNIVTQRKMGTGFKKCMEQSLDQWAS